MENIINILEEIRDHCQKMHTYEDCKKNCIFYVGDHSCFFGDDVLPCEWETGLIKKGGYYGK